jgi:hypothetical protein
VAEAAADTDLSDHVALADAPGGGAAPLSFDTVNCPNCGTANPEGARFCNVCGARLDATGGGTTALDPLLPRELLPKLEAARAGRATAT